MTIIQAIILGVIQGLTEFLPISSSAHLNLFPWLLKWQSMPDSFDVALHVGTLLAIVVYFFKDWIKLIVGGYKQVVKKEKTIEGKIFWQLVIATIPAGILSLILDKISSKIIGDNLNLKMILIAIALIVMGILLYWVDKNSKSIVKYEKITLKQSILIGISQALAAAFPGVSRSGITMTVARWLKIDRESAAKYSFLLFLHTKIIGTFSNENKILSRCRSPCCGILKKNITLYPPIIIFVFLLLIRFPFF